MAGDFYSATRHRLTAYGVFSDETLDFVAEKAQAQREFSTYQKFFASVGMPKEPTFFMDDSGRGVFLVDLDARAAKEKGVMVVHLPMNNSLDTNQLYQVAWLAYVYPEYRVIAFGNPSGAPFRLKEQRFSFADWMRMSFTKHRRASVGVELSYLTSQGIHSAVHIGFSYGAIKALLLTSYAPIGAVEKLIILDPVSHPRNPLRLLSDFNKTSRRLAEYVNRTGLKTFLDARADAARTVDYNGGLLSSPNIAIGLMIARVNVHDILVHCLQRDPSLRVFAAWGTKSELSDDMRMQATVSGVQEEVSPKRIHGQPLKDDSHAFANDLHEFAALVNTALLW